MTDSPASYAPTAYRPSGANDNARVASVASEEDRAAAAWLLGLEGKGARMTFRTWEMPGSAGRIWTVEEREDTKLGGKYLHCPCPSWRFGLTCKHTERAREIGA